MIDNYYQTSQTSYASTQTPKQSNSAHKNLYLKTLSETTKKLESPRYLVSQNDKYSTKQLMIQIMQKHKEAKNSVEQMKVKRDKNENAEIDHMLKSGNLNEDVIKKLQIQENSTQRELYSDQRAISSQETPKRYEQFLSEQWKNKEMQQS